MAIPTVQQVKEWKPDVLNAAASDWTDTATDLDNRLDTVGTGASASTEYWSAASGAAARDRAAEIVAGGRQIVAALVTAAAAARGGAHQVGQMQQSALHLIADIEAKKFRVSPDGSVTAPPPEGWLIAILGGDTAIAQGVMESRARQYEADIKRALAAVGVADDIAASAVADAFAAIPAAAESVAAPGAQGFTDANGNATSPAAFVDQWNTMNQNQINQQIANLNQDQRDYLTNTFPQQVGSTNGVPWEMRFDANRANIAQAIVDERQALHAYSTTSEDDKIIAAVRRRYDQPDFDPAKIKGGDRNPAMEYWVWLKQNPGEAAEAIAEPEETSRNRISMFEGMLGTVRDPVLSEVTEGSTDGWVDRQILLFDPSGNGKSVEVHGNIDTAANIGVIVPGTNTTLLGSDSNVEVARDFVREGRGDLAVISWIGADFPQSILTEAPSNSFAENASPDLVAFSHEVDRVANADGRDLPVTFVGHSYGGSMLGTAEADGLVADRIVHVESAGSGVGVRNPGDWHNPNPNVERYTLTAPGDPIGSIQGFALGWGPHGADPDTMPGVVQLDTGFYDEDVPDKGIHAGDLVNGPGAHGGVLDYKSDAWRNIFGVMTGGEVTLNPTDRILVEPDLPFIGAPPIVAKRGTEVRVPVE